MNWILRSSRTTLTLIKLTLITAATFSFFPINKNRNFNWKNINFSSTLTNSTKLTNKFTSGEIVPSISFRPEPLRKEPTIKCVETFIKPRFFYKEYPLEPAKLLMSPFKKDYICFIPVLWVSEKFTNALATLILAWI